MDFISLAMVAKENTNTERKHCIRILIAPPTVG